VVFGCLVINDVTEVINTIAKMGDHVTNGWGCTEPLQNVMGSGLDVAALILLESIRYN
jgi:hypothetical protein